MALDNAFPQTPRAPISEYTSSASEEELFVDVQEFLPELFFIQDISREELGRDSTSEVLNALTIKLLAHRRPRGGVGRLEMFLPSISAFDRAKVSMGFRVGFFE